MRRSIAVAVLVVSFCIPVRAQEGGDVGAHTQCRRNCLDGHGGRTSIRRHIEKAFLPV